MIPRETCPRCRVPRTKDDRGLVCPRCGSRPHARPKPRWGDALKAEGATGVDGVRGQ